MTKKIMPKEERDRLNKAARKRSPGARKKRSKAIAEATENGAKKVASKKTSKKKTATEAPAADNRTRRKINGKLLPIETMISPRAVAAHYGCAIRAVQVAIEKGLLPHTPILGPENVVTARGIRVCDLDCWQPDPERQARLKK